MKSAETRTIRERLNDEKLPMMPLPYIDLPEPTCGFAPGRYLSVDALGAAASEWDSDDLRLVWEVVSNWSVSDEATAYLDGWHYPDAEETE